MTRKPRTRRFTEATEAQGVIIKNPSKADIVGYKQLAFADDGRAIWDQQPDEPLRAYGWFALYRDMPPQDRKVAAVAELANRRVNYMYVISARDRWRERAAAWDQEELRKWVLRQDAARRRTVNGHLRLSDEMIRIAMARLRTLDPEKLSLRDLPMFVDVAAKIGRAALGLDTPAVLAATQINVDRSAGSTEAGHQAAQQEAAEVFAQVAANLGQLAGRMTEQQRRDALTSWLPPADAIDGELVEG